MSLFAVRDGKLKYINKTNYPNIIVMADWASKANYNNPHFTIYHILQFVKHKGIYWGEKSIYRLLRSRLCDVTAMREHFRYASRTPLSRTGLFTVFCHPVSYCEVLPARFVSPACFVAAWKNVPKNSFGARFVTLFQQHCNTFFLFPPCVYRCAWMRSRAVLRCVLLSPLQIMIKINLFCILGSHRSQLCQIWLRSFWIILCFGHVLWMPCKYNTFDGRLLWFDGV